MDHFCYLCFLHVPLNLTNRLNKAVLLLWISFVIYVFVLSHFQLVLMNRINKTEPAVFVYCRLSLFLKDPFFPDY